jgi:hypothetical protein
LSNDLSSIGELHTSKSALASRRHLPGTEFGGSHLIVGPRVSWRRGESSFFGDNQSLADRDEIDAG